MAVKRRTVKRKATPKQLRALKKGRATLKAMRRAGVKPKAKRRRNPGPPTRGAVMARDIKNLTKGTTARRATQQKVGKKSLTRYPQAGTKTLGYRKNPPHYVIKRTDATKYFDGAGFVSSKTDAAQYMRKAKAAAIAQKVADALNKTVSVVPV